MSMTSKRPYIFLVVAFLLILSLPASSTLVSAQETTEEPVPVEETEQTPEPEEPTEVVTEETSVTPIPTEETTLAEPSAAPTEEIPLEEPSEVATEAEVTEVVTEVTDTLSEATVEATEPATELPVETTEEVPASEVPTEATQATEATPELTSFTDDFEAFNGDGWLLSGWQGSSDSTNGYLSSTQANATAMIEGFNQADFELTTQMRISPSNTASITFRSNGEAYQAVFNNAGSSRLYRGTNLLDNYTFPASTEAEWFSVQIIAANNTVSVSVNGIAGIVYTDDNALGAGTVTFGTGANNTQEVSIDNVMITTVNAGSVVFPVEATPFPTTTAIPPQPEVTTEPNSPEVTAEATTEVTPEVTAEVTAEATAEITPEVTAEITAEATAEVTAEVTPEVTAEVTEEADSAYDKLNDNLREAHEAASNTEELITQLEQYGFEFNTNNQVFIEIVVERSLAPESIQSVLDANNATAYSFGRYNVVVASPAQNIIEIARDERVVSINYPSLAYSTGTSNSGVEAPSGTAYTSAYDLLGVQDWHDAGYTGAGVKIGVVDIGFGAPGAIAGDEYACYAGNIGNLGTDSTHGLNTIQVLCDIVPDADVYALTAVNAQNLATVISDARSLDLNILVITLDLGVDQSPGDGDGISNAPSDPSDAYYQLERARAEGIIVIASAGNNGVNAWDNYTTASSEISNYISFGFDSTTVGHTAIVTLEASAEDEIRISWSDWNGNAGTIANLEDFDFTLRRASDDEVFREETAERFARQDAPAVIFPSILGNDCPVDEFGDASCTVELVIERVSGDAFVDFQIQIIPKARPAIDRPDPLPDDPAEVQGPTYFIDVTSANFTIGTSTGGTIARPADSTNVIAVGAVCANEASNFTLLPSSSVGPIYGTDGVDPGVSAFTPGSLTRSQTGVDVVSFAHVDTTIESLIDTALCTGLVGGEFTTGGYGGTSAAASHVGGMAALLLSNTTINTKFLTGNSTGVQALIDYLQTHSAELPLGSSADSFDYSTGAGLTILGAPEYNIANTTNVGVAPDGIACSNIVYVGQALVGGTQNGSLSNPYTSLAYAITQASDCVVVMPGEYVTPLLIQDGNIRIFGYNSISGDAYNESIIRVVGQYNNGTYTTASAYDGYTPNFYDNAGIYVDGVSDVTLYGFHIIPSTTAYSETLLRQALIATGSDNFVLENNVIGGGTSNGITYEGWGEGDDEDDTTPVLIFESDGVTIRDNTFADNAAAFTGTDVSFPGIAIVNSGIDGNETQLLYNVFNNNSAVGSGSVTALWPAIVFSNNSAVDFVGNAFNGNTASSIISGQTPDSSTLRLRAVSNVFINNVAASPQGPMIHAYYVPRLSVINNTFGNNTGSFMSIAGRGSQSANNNGIASPTTDANMDFFNNLVYLTSATGGFYNTVNNDIVDCSSLDAGVATQFNWWQSYSGTCSTDMASNGNNTSDNPLSEFIGEQSVNLTMSQVNYWALSSLDPGYSRGIDFSNVTSSTVGDINLASVGTIFGRDYRNQARQFDVEFWEQNSDATDDASHQMDVGAFEFQELDILDSTPTSLVITEDNNGGISNAIGTSPIIIDLTPSVLGGFGELTYTMVETPSIFGTHCGAAYTNANNGTVLGQGINNGKIFYCPPSHFYNDDTKEVPNVSNIDFDPNTVPPSYTYPADTDNWPDYLFFVFSVVDESGDSDAGLAVVDIVGVDDTALNVSAAIGDETPDATDIFRETGNVGTLLTFEMRPYVSFDSNFFFSEDDNPEYYDAGSSTYRVDYPFTYSAASVITGDINYPNELLLDDLDITVDNDLDTMSVQLPAESTGSSFIQYTVADSNSGSGTTTVIVEVRAVSRIPVDIGIYDDASFAFDYADAAGETEGNWQALSSATAINNTLHMTNLLGDTATFGFKNNSGFILYMNSAGSLGGVYDIDIDGESLNDAGWTLMANSTLVYETTLSSGFHCTTSKIIAGSLHSAGAGFYTVTCNNEAALGNETYIVTVTNKTNFRRVFIDAFAIIDNPTTNYEPLSIGTHDVDQAGVRSIFGTLGTQWAEIRSFRFSNGVAMRAQVTNPAPLNFSVTDASGFALGTTLEIASGTYRICVTNTATTQVTCQDFNNSPDAFTPARSNVFRPFYGLDPNVVYDVTIDNISLATNGNFYIDSIVVFDETITPEREVEGVVEADELDFFVYGGGIAESWRLLTNDVIATERSIMRLVPGIIGAGPYIAFETELDVSTIYYTYSELAVSQQAMVCVDRNLGVDTTADSAYGDCLRVNLLTGDYVVINADGTETTPPDNNIKVSTGTIRIDESLFRNGTWTATSGVHTFEIFSMHDRQLSLDRVVAIGADVPLTAGRYEEYTENFGYLVPDGVGGYVDAPEIGENATAYTPAYTGNYTNVTGFGATRDSSRGIMYTEEIGNVITFEINGTGFAPMVRMNPFGGALNICWLAYAGAPDAPQDILANGTCQHYDTEALLLLPNTPLSILGLPEDTYAVAIELLGDDFDTAYRRSLALWFDGVTVYGDDLALAGEEYDERELNPLENGVTYEGNFNAQFTANTFAYLESGWRHLASVLFSASNYDTTRTAGATVAFIVDDASTIVLKRRVTTIDAELLICAQALSSATERTCGTVAPSTSGVNNEFTFQLPSVGDYIISLTNVNGGAFNFDAVRAVGATAPLTAGLYDDDNPAINFGRSSTNLIRNGDMERDNVDEITYWDDTGSAISSQFNFIRYSGLFSRKVDAPIGDGIQSLPFSLRDEQSYSLVAYVYISATTGGDVRVSLDSTGLGNIATTVVSGAVNQWIPVRINFVQNGNADGDAVLSFTAESGTTQFYVDGVTLNEGSNWQSQASILFTENFATASTSHGAEFSFEFTGTGFALGTPTNVLTAGEMRVCWLPEASISSTNRNADVINNGTCMTYQQQEFVTSFNNMRVVTGLPLNTYRVVVSDVEDGIVNSASFAVRGTPRFWVRQVGVITLDWIEIFNETAPNPGITSGEYNESDVNTNGERYLQLEPSNRWATFSAPNLVAFSELSYVGATLTNGRLDPTSAGQAASLYVDIPEGEAATIIFDVNARLFNASDQLLACVNGPEGAFVYDAAEDLYVYEEPDAQDADDTTIANCAVLPDLRLSRFVTLNSDILPPLANTALDDAEYPSSTRVVTIQTLTRGIFRIDGYQILGTTTLSAGYYEESIGTGILVPSDATAWATSVSPVYSGGGALEARNITGADDVQTLTFDFTGSGVSVVTALLTNGGELELNVTDGGLIDITETLDTRRGANLFGKSITIAGLPEATYTATLTITNNNLERVIVDAIEVYGTLPQLGSLYDDADVAADGTPLFTYGPANATWITLSGTQAPFALNKTLHSGRNRGAVVAFEIGATTDAQGIILYYDDSTTVPQVDVCFRDVASPADVYCDDPVTVNDNADKKTIVPAGLVPGNYLVTIEHNGDAGFFNFDAVQVIEDGFTEGIYDAESMLALGDTSGGAELVGTNAVLEANGEYIDLTVDPSGVGFSFTIQHTFATSDNYQIRIYDSTNNPDCQTGNDPATECIAYEDLPLVGDSVPVTGFSALTYVGMEDVNSGTEYIVQLRNTSTTGQLQISEFHVLGDDDSLQITSNERFENNDPQIRYLPFGSVTETQNRFGGASELSEHTFGMQGAVAYFEFDDDDITTQQLGFAFARRIGLFGFTNAELCYGQIGIETLIDVRATNCTTVDNTQANAYQAIENITTPSVDYCGANGCWATVRSLGAGNSTFDFIRLFDAADTLMFAGYYEDNATGIVYLDSDDGYSGSWEEISAGPASGGFLHSITIDDDDALRRGDGPVATFLMEGTGFSVSFTSANNADAVQMCFIEYTGAETHEDALSDGVCQTFDNERIGIPKYQSARRIVGLPYNQYVVAVQMLSDNTLSVPHFNPALTTQIDAVEIYDIDWLATNSLEDGKRYETHHRNRIVDNNFIYLGNRWLTQEAPTLTAYSGFNIDSIAEYGATLVFNTSEDAMTFYTRTARAYSAFRICVIPDGSVTDMTCRDYHQIDNVGVNFSAPFTFQFADFDVEPSTQNVVTISTLEDRTMFFDAVEVDTTFNDAGPNPVPLTEGTYESTDASVFYDSEYYQFVPNSGMERNSYWSPLSGPNFANFSSIARYSGYFGYYVSANEDAGIESTGFEVDGDGGIYTLVARIRVRAGSVNVRLVEGDNVFSIPEFTTTTVTTDVFGWQTVRVDFEIPAGIYTNYFSVVNGLHVQILANEDNTLFDVDDVTLSKGARWAGSYTPIASGGHYWISKSHGASFNFAFEGTGFELGTVASRAGGELQVCYVTKATYDSDVLAGDDGFINANCLDYQQENLANVFQTRRVVTGLPYDIYYVRAKDVEDGYSNIIARRESFQRLSIFDVGQIAIDYVRIYNDDFVADSIAAAQLDAEPDEAYYTLEPGFYDEDARNPVTGEQYLRLTPGESWSLIEGFIARLYSGQRYYAAVDSLGRADRISSGHAATLYVDVPVDGSTVILNTALASFYNSKVLLICAGDMVSADGFDGELTWDGTNYNVANSADCTTRNLTLTTSVVVGGDELDALSGNNPGVKRVSFTTLDRGFFYIDSYQIIYGDALPPGIYDNAMPDNLLDFATTSSDSVTDLPFCNLVQLDSEWCNRKSVATYSRTAVVTQSLDATMNFNIEGTGFSIVTSISGLGVDFTICYAKTPASGNTPNFPSRTQMVDGSRNLIWDNSAQNLDENGIYCDVVTSNSIRWLSRFPDRIRPLGTQYGFSYYGLPNDEYSVQVTMIDDTLLPSSPQVLEIDAVVVFSNHSDDDLLPVMTAGFYDSAEAPISYEASPFWTTQTSVNSVPFGYFGRSEEYTTNAGAIAQMQVEGNAITLYHTVLFNRSRDVRVCLLVTYATIHCMQDSNITNEGLVTPPDEPYALAVDMANFSQFGPASYFTPVMFYGLGEGEHQIILENRDHRRGMGIDAIHVHD